MKNITVLFITLAGFPSHTRPFVFFTRESLGCRQILWHCLQVFLCTVRTYEDEISKFPNPCSSAFVSSLDPSWRTWRRVKLLEKWYKIRIMKNVMYLLRFFFAITMEKKKMESGEVIWHENLDSNLKMKFNFRRE